MKNRVYTDIVLKIRFVGYKFRCCKAWIKLKLTNSNQKHIISYFWEHLFTSNLHCLVNMFRWEIYHLCETRGATQSSHLKSKLMKNRSGRNNWVSDVWTRGANLIAIQSLPCEIKIIIYFPEEIVLRKRNQTIQMRANKAFCFERTWNVKLCNKWKPIRIATGNA